jgi:hypothetical protein
MAKKIGIPHVISESSKKIIVKGSDDQKNALRMGDVGIRKVYGQQRREERRGTNPEGQNSIPIWRII